jgi:transposase
MQIDDVSILLLHVQSNYDNGLFSKYCFSLSNVHHSFSKLKRILTLMTIKENSLEINKIYLKPI